MIAPGSWLGLLGGGQLGRMFTMAAQSMGYKVVVLDPGTDSPAGSVADDHIAADYLDRDALAQLADRCAATTTEFENVPADSLRALAQRGVGVLLVEQKMTMALRVASHVLVMGHGQIVFTGSTADMQARDDIRRDWLEVA